MDGLVLSIAAVDPFVVRDVGISIAALLLMPISLFILRESYWNIGWFVVVACATSALTYYQLGYLLSAAPSTTPHGIYIEQLLCALLFGACAAPACVLWWRRCTSSRDGGGNDVPVRLRRTPVLLARLHDKERVKFQCDGKVKFQCDRVRCQVSSLQVSSPQGLSVKNVRVLVYT